VMPTANEEGEAAEAAPETAPEPEAVEVEASPACEGCGAELKPDMRFCPDCGQLNPRV